MGSIFVFVNSEKLYRRPGLAPRQLPPLPLPCAHRISTGLRDAESGML